jgi:dipeptidyl-peptidase-4
VGVVTRGDRRHGTRPSTSAIRPQARHAEVSHVADGGRWIGGVRSIWDGQGHLSGRVDWAPDGKTVYVQRLNRAQTRLDMLAVDPATGKSRVLFTEQARDEELDEPDRQLSLPRDGSLIWWSERDGFGHLYRFRRPVAS